MCACPIPPEANELTLLPTHEEGLQLFKVTSSPSVQTETSLLPALVQQTLICRLFLCWCPVCPGIQ